MSHARSGRTGRAQRAHGTPARAARTRHWLRWFAERSLLLRPWTHASGHTHLLLPLHHVLVEGVVQRVRHQVLLQRLLRLGRQIALRFHHNVVARALPLHHAGVHLLARVHGVAPLVELLLARLPIGIGAGGAAQCPSNAPLEHSKGRMGTGMCARALRVTRRQLQRAASGASRARRRAWREPREPPCSVLFFRRAPCAPRRRGTATWPAPHAPHPSRARRRAT